MLNKFIVDCIAQHECCNQISITEAAFVHLRGIHMLDIASRRLSQNLRLII